MSVVKLDISALMALGFDRVQADALRHMLHQIGAQTGGITLPEVVAQAAIDADVSSSRADVAELRKEIDALKAQLDTLATSAAQLAELAKSARTIELTAAFPPPLVGTLGAQNADHVVITGGTIGIDAGSVSVPTLYFALSPQTGFYRSGADKIAVTVAGVRLAELSTQLVDVTGGIKLSKQLTSTQATGTAPFVVASTTRVDNLNADKLDDKDWAAPAAIGNVTPDSGKFTTLAATGAFGCNGAAPQPSAVSGGTVTSVAATNVTPYGYSTAAQADDIVTKLNTVISALVFNGILS